MKELDAIMQKLRIRRARHEIKPNVLFVLIPARHFMKNVEHSSGSAQVLKVSNNIKLFEGLVLL